MTTSQVVFIIVAGISLVSAIMVVSLRKLMRAAFAFVLSLLGVAIIFAMLGSGFFAIVQVVVYIGAIAILIIFSVMLIQNVMDDSIRQLNRAYILVGIGSAIFFAALVFVLSAWGNFNSIPADIPEKADDLALLGIAFADPHGFVLPFEAVTMLLLSALIGGIFIAREHKDR